MKVVVEIDERSLKQAIGQAEQTRVDRYFGARELAIHERAGRGVKNGVEVVASATGNGPSREPAARVGVCTANFYRRADGAGRPIGIGLLLYGIVPDDVVQAIRLTLGDEFSGTRDGDAITGGSAVGCENYAVGKRKRVGQADAVNDVI